MPGFTLDYLPYRNGTGVSQPKPPPSMEAALQAEAPPGVAPQEQEQAPQEEAVAAVEEAAQQTQEVKPSARPQAEKLQEVGTHLLMAPLVCTNLQSGLDMGALFDGRRWMILHGLPCTAYIPNLATHPALEFK